MPRHIWLCVALVLPIVALSASEIGVLGAPKAITISGEVLVTMPGGAQRPLHPGERIPLGAKLQTGETGELLVAAQPGIAILLGNDSRAYVSQWKRAPAAEVKPDPDLPPVSAEATLTLTKGTVFGVVEPGTKFERILTLDTTIGRFTAKNGVFSVSLLGKSIQAVTVSGFLEIDTRFDQKIQNEANQYKLPAARTILIPSTGELQVQDPVSKQWSPKAVSSLTEDDAVHYFSRAMVAGLEAISTEIVSDQILLPSIVSLAQVGKDAQAQVPFILDIGQQLTVLIGNKEVSPPVAQIFISLAQSHGVSISDETAKGIHHAIHLLDHPGVPDPEVPQETDSGTPLGK